MLVREHPGHGRAAFADRAFRVGDLVWQEEPLIKWQGNTHTNSSVLLAVNSFLEAVAAATPEVRRTIEQHFRAPEPGPGSLVPDIAEALSSVHEGIPLADLTRLISLVRSNAHSFEGGKASALFPQAAMVSHSCAPNLRVQTTGEKLFYYAIKPIAAGDLLSFSYLDQQFLWQPTRTRVQLLSEPYGFVCHCSRCDGLDTTRCFTCPECKGDVHPDERPFIAAMTARQSGAVDLTFSCKDCGASVPENRLPLDEEVRLYRDVLRLLQAAQDPEKYDWGTNVSAAREKLSQRHWIYAQLCKRRGENGLPMVIVGAEAPTATFLCFMRAIAFSKALGEPSLMQFDFPLYIRVCKPRLDAIADLMKTTAGQFNWAEWIVSVQEFWRPQIIEAAEKDDAFEKLVGMLGEEPIIR